MDQAAPRSRLRLLVLILLAGVSSGVPVQDVQKRAQSFDQRQEGSVNVQIDFKDVRVVALVDSDVFEDYANYDYAYDYADFTIKPKPTPKPKPPSTTPSSSVSSSSSSPSSPANNPPSLLTILSSGTNSSPKPVIPAESSTVVVPSTTQATSASAEIASSADAAHQPSVQIRPAVNISSLLEGDSAAPISAPPQQIDVSQVLQETKPENEPISSSSTIPSISSSSSTVAPGQAQPYSAWTHEQQLSETSNVGSSVPPAILIDPRRKCPTGFLLKAGKCFKRRLSLISPRLALMKLAPALIRQTKMLTSGLRSSAAVSRAIVVDEHH